MTDSKTAPVARQVVVSFVCVAVATALEATAAALGDHTPAATASEIAAASLDVFALYAPIGLAVGVASGLVLLALSKVRWLRPLGRLSLSPRDLFRRRPAAFGNLLAAVIVIAAFAGAVTYSSYGFATRFHAPWLAAGANAAAVLLIAGLCAIGYGLLSVATRALARAIGPLASVGVFALLCAVVVAVALRTFVGVYPEFFYTYAPARVAWGPGLLAVFTLASIGAADVERRRRSGQATRIAAAVCSAVSVLALCWVGLVYGDDNRVRHVVEDQTIAGGSVVRFYIGLTDRDGDGFSFAFGGGDCDDTDPNVYPGAPDPPGDGIDADCFAGDGGPSVAELGDGRYGPVPDAVPRPPNILFLSVDALRPDHLGVNGYDRETSPNLDAFAAEATVFENAYAQSTRSIRSMTSLMTGLYPSEIRYGDEIEWTGLDPQNETLAETLGARGYQTTATIGGTYFERSHGFFQGFDDVTQREDRTRAVAVQTGLMAIDRMEREGDPWFLWLHLMNVHQPYLPDGRPSRFGEELMDRYDEEIVLADEQVGRVLERLEERGLADDTIVVIWSDHGEAFGEHGAFGHTTTLYEEELRSVLMLRVPGVEPRRVADRVGLIDLFATTLNLARYPVPRPVASRSLVPLITGERESLGERVLISEILPDGRFPFDRKAILRGRYKLHWWVREGRWALYDLEADPGEEDDLSADDPDTAQELLGLLRSWTSSSSLPEHQRRHAIRSDILSAPPARLEHRLNAGFQGAFTLLGCNVDESDVRPGGTLSVQCFYRVDASTARDYQFVLEAAVPPDHPRLHHMRSEHFPVGGRYMTSEWRPGEIVRDRVTLSLPRALRWGTTLTVTLAIRDGRVPLSFEDGRRTLRIESVEVTGPRRAPTPSDGGVDAGTDEPTPTP